MHIVALIAGEPRAAVAMCEAAIERGVFAQAIRPPSVAPGTSRLRLTATASHTPAELRMAAAVLGDAARAAGMEPAQLAPVPVAERQPQPELAPDAFAQAYGDWLQDGDDEIGEPSYARLKARPRGPFDLESSGDWSPGGEPELDRQRAPFDVEREASIARAA